MNKTRETSDAGKKTSPWLKMALELGPVILFFVVFGRLKDKTFTILGTEYSGFIVTTALFVGLIMLTSAILWRLEGKLSKMQMVTLVIVIVMGGLSIWLNDERFIKMKPTFIYAFFAGILFFGLLRGQSYLRSVMHEGLPMRPEGWMILTWRFAVFFLALAVINELVWRNFTTEQWVSFKTFALTLAPALFIFAQYSLISRYTIADEPQNPPSPPPKPG
jgi:intracellular septation protein